MFAYQAQEAFKLWHGSLPSINKEALDMLKMTKIAITGSLASGKSTVAKLMSRQLQSSMQISQ